jgi:hypothetical protein
VERGDLDLGQRDVPRHSGAKPREQRAQMAAGEEGHRYFMEEFDEIGHGDAKSTPMRRASDISVTSRS